LSERWEDLELIVLHEQKWLIMQPPHTASRSLHKAMSQQHGAHIHIGHTPDWFAVDHHTTLITYGLRDYAKAIVVRDPFDRAVGLWHHLVQFNSTNGYGCCDFSRFAGWLRDGDPENILTWMYEYTINDWLAIRDAENKVIGETAFDVPLRFEHLAGDIKHWIGLDVTLPTETKTKRGPIDNYYRDQATVDAIAIWAADDLRRWYPTLLHPEADRFGLSPQLVKIMENTADVMFGSVR
jgi:hypothetical protein